MARSLNVSDKGSKLDIINRIKSVLNIEETFLKLFSKMWGGSGKVNLKLFHKDDDFRKALCIVLLTFIPTYIRFIH